MDEVTSQQPTDDAREMEQYGLDPNSPADIEQWHKETEGAPVASDSQPDYSRDAFEFGGVPDQPAQDESEESEDNAA